jgi:hypothetical protein
MKQSVKLIVLIPVGPMGSSYQYDDIIDTLNSIIYYTTPDRRIIIQDNSFPMHLGERLKQTFPDLLVVRTPQNYGLYGGLYKAESLALIFAHTAFNFQVLVRMDIDAIITGKGLEDDALDFFKDNPKVGLLGNYLTSGEGVDWPNDQIQAQTNFLGWLRDRQRSDYLRKLVSMAKANGYKPGDHILGGACIFSAALVEKLVRQGFLLREELRRAKLQNDHIFGLLCKAAGMDMADFHSESKPMAVAWKGLPLSPQELVEKNKKLVHSTRFWKDMNEEQVRLFFRARRT